MASTANYTATESVANEPETENSKTGRANKAVRNYTVASVVVGAVPLPVVDLLCLSGLQLKMLHKLSKLYEVQFSEQLGKSLIASLIGGGVPLSFSTSLASLVKSLAKSVPVYGTATGMISVAVFGGASTYAIGKVFIQHFESGGTFLDFDPEQVKDYYAKQFKDGQQEAKAAIGKKS
ncbi:MAG: YcjF family protein [Gammaproteobacteria bacterium]